MARPVLDKLYEKKLENSTILISFFSPSGYEQRKKYDKVQGVVYLPLDTKSNAREFIELANPYLAVFVKYEFWQNILRELEKKKINALLINGLFRPGQWFFKPIGKEIRTVLATFDHIFLQNNLSQKLLQDAGIHQTTVTGDIRFDRVLAIKNEKHEFPELKAFLNSGFVLIAGSSWPIEESLLKKVSHKLGKKLKLILVPHDVSQAHLNSVESLFKGSSVYRFSKMNEDRNPDVVLVDSIGILSGLYSVSHMAFIGGGFTGALHNILEPAVYGIPVAFGSIYNKFPEAEYFIRNEIAYSINSSEDLLNVLNKFISNPELAESVKNKVQKVFKANAGGTDQIYHKIKGYYSF